MIAALHKYVYMFYTSFGSGQHRLKFWHPSTQCWPICSGVSQFAKIFAFYIGLHSTAPPVACLSLYLLMDTHHIIIITLVLCFENMTA